MELSNAITSTENACCCVNSPSDASNASIFIASDGDVGFETTTPDGQFDVAHSSNVNDHAFLIDPSSNVGVNIDNGFTPNGIFDVQTTGGQSLFTVKNDGRIAFGTNTISNYFGVTPTVELRDVDGQFPLFAIASNDDTTTASLAFGSNGNNKWLISSRHNFSSPTRVDRLAIYNSTGDEIFTFMQDGSLTTHTGAHLTAGGVWTNNSTKELKENILNISTKEALKALAALNPVTYNYITEPSESYAGFIAEEVPELVATSDKKSLATMDIVAVLTKVVKEQQKSLKKMKSEISKLKSLTEN